MGFLCAFILGFCGCLFLLLQKIAYKCQGVICIVFYHMYFVCHMLR